jgi:hypothetical protein
MAKQFIMDDELENVEKKTTKPTTKPSVKEELDEEDTPVPAAKTSSKSTNFNIGEDIDFQDEKVMSLSEGLDRLRPDKGAAVRFSILPKDWLKPKMARTHYIEKKGTYICLSTKEHQAICCDKLEPSSVTIIAPVLHYTNANHKDGKYVKAADGTIPPIHWEIKYVQLSLTNYRDISMLVPEEEEGSNDAKKTVSDIDIIMTHKGANKIGYQFTSPGMPARWRKNAELVAEVERAFEKYKDGKKMSSRLGKAVSAEEMKIIIAGSKATDAESANLDDVEEL